MSCQSRVVIGSSSNSTDLLVVVAVVGIPLRNKLKSQKDTAPGLASPITSPLYKIINRGPPASRHGWRDLSGWVCCSHIMSAARTVGDAMQDSTAQDPSKNPESSGMLAERTLARRQRQRGQSPRVSPAGLQGGHDANFNQTTRTNGTAVSARHV